MAPTAGIPAATMSVMASRLIARGGHWEFKDPAYFLGIRSHGHVPADARTFPPAIHVPGYERTARLSYPPYALAQQDRPELLYPPDIPFNGLYPPVGCAGGRRRSRGHSPERRLHRDSR